MGGGGGGAVLDQPARDLQASEGAGAGRPDIARPRGAAAPTPPRAEAPRRSHEMAGELPALLGGHLRAPGRPARRAQGQETTTERTHEAIEEITDEEGNPEDHDSRRP